MKMKMDCPLWGASLRSPIQFNGVLSCFLVGILSLPLSGCFSLSGMDALMIVGPGRNDREIVRTIPKQFLDSSLIAALERLDSTTLSQLDATRQGAHFELTRATVGLKLEVEAGVGSASVMGEGAFELRYEHVPN